MYFYLYDSFLQNKKYNKLLSEIEASLIDLGIQGRTSKLNVLNNIKEVINDAVKRGAETIVVLGDDKTISKAINSIVDLNATLGIIPIGRDNALAAYLGIPEGVAACNVLSKRIKERIDVASVNGNYFAFYLKAMSPNIKIVSANGEFSLTPLSCDMKIYVCNFKPAELELKEKLKASFFMPQDGHLELVIQGSNQSSLINKLFAKTADRINDCTILPFRKIKLESIDPENGVKLVLDNDKIIKTPAQIEILPKCATVIVGNKRYF
ncbi:MAG: diacylglycerol kinase family protein [Patescibacteria group bacterium]